MVFYTMLKRFFVLLCFSFLISCTTRTDTTTNHFYQQVSFLNQHNNDLTIDEVVKLFRQGDFSVAMKNSIFYEMKHKEATWFHFKLGDYQENQIFTIWNNFLDYSKVYLLLPDGSIEAKSEFSLLEKGKFNGNTRKPIWQFGPKEANSDVFVRLEDYNLKTNLNLFLLTSDQHNQLLQKENMVILVQAFFLLILFIFILLIFIARKQQSLLWYTIYILLFLVEYLFHMGVHNQFNLFNYPILQSASQVFLPNNGMLFACLFFIQFYSYSKETLWVQKAFQIITYYFALVALIFCIFFVFDKILFPKEIIIYTARIAIICILLLHIYLAFKRTIPYYLAIAFNLPIISFFVFINDSPTFDTSFEEMLVFDNLLYAATSIEIFIVIFFIVRSLIDIEITAIRLKNENLVLRNSFNDSVLKAQEVEKSKLLENVHDSFGGYLEALKLRLIPKDDRDSGKVKEILDSFYKEYRYLLNNLYSPKINAKNLTDHLIDFIKKQNQLIDHKIRYDFAIDNLQLSPEKSVHIYRIISELTTNSIKHSRASVIDLKISQNSDSHIKIEVSDNGIGFSEFATNSNSYGLKNVKNRVSNMNGTIDIQSDKDCGVRVAIEIPNND